MKYLRRAIRETKKIPDNCILYIDCHAETITSPHLGLFSDSQTAAISRILEIRFSKQKCHK
jgi:hypothetical protein